MNTTISVRFQLSSNGSERDREGMKTYIDYRSLYEFLELVRQLLINSKHILQQTNAF